MRYFVFTFLCFAILTINSCTSDNANNGSNKRVDYNYLGDAFCKCAQPTIELNQELQQLQKTDKQAFLGKLKEAGKKSKESISCCKESMKNHTSTIPNPNELRKALKNECEGIPDQMLDEIVRIVDQK